jgi:hypothetical protein
MTMRYIRGTFTGTDDNDFDVTFQWGDTNRNVLNTITTEISNVSICH